MSLFIATALILSQASAAEIVVPPAVTPMSDAEARLADCMTLARRDPATAISDANQWLEGLPGVERSYPIQCLGFAYTSLLRWDAARDAFVSARDIRAGNDHLDRARLGAMAGNAALAARDFTSALELFTAARGDALAAGNNELAGTIEAEPARAHVGLGQTEQAAQSLAEARGNAPQVSDVWLLSATLARREGDLANAQGWIETAAALAPQDAAVGLEAGLIAALAGFDDAARTSWQSVIATAKDSPQAESARSYLAQLDAVEAP